MLDGPILQARDVVKVFGSGPTAVRAVDGISLALEKGEIACIMGPSGSGKTTLLSILGALLRPTSGFVSIAGDEVTAAAGGELPRIRAQHIGFIFQAFNLLASLTAVENVLFPIGLLPRAMRNPRRARERATALLERLGLSARAGALPRALSGGEKQRVAIARALINDPRIILADEPTGNLDSRNGQEVMMMLQEMAREEGRTILVVSHDPRIEDIVDRVLWLEDGKVRDRRPDAKKWQRDPVCGMQVDIWTSELTADHDGEQYHFCSARCVERFVAEPGHFVEIPGPEAER